MTMRPRLRKFVLTVHLTASLGWIGALIAYLALAVSAVTSQDGETVRAAWIATEMTGWYVIVPLAFAALLTGLVLSLGTRWGLFRHYWVLVTLLLTIFSTTILLRHMPMVTVRAGMARSVDDAGLQMLGSDLLHPGLGLGVLLLVTVLNVYKPRGMTRYGWRKERERQSQSQA